VGVAEDGEVEMELKVLHVEVPQEMEDVVPKVNRVEVVVGVGKELQTGKEMGMWMDVVGAGVEAAGEDKMRTKPKEQHAHCNNNRVPNSSDLLTFTKWVRTHILYGCHASRKARPRSS
jgi:hypothetical protein